MLKKLLALLFILGVLMSLAACTPEDKDPCLNCIDDNADGICDVCDKEILSRCDSCTDSDGDDVCDVCGEEMVVPPSPPETPGEDEEDEIGGNVNGDGSFDLPGDKFK